MRPVLSNACLHFFVACHRERQCASEAGGVRGGGSHERALCGVCTAVGTSMGIACVDNNGFGEDIQVCRRNPTGKIFVCVLREYG